MVDVKTHEAVGKLTYAATLTDCGPQMMKDVTLKIRPPSAAEETDLPPAMFETVTDKIVDELEDWKERQKQIFQQEVSAELRVRFYNLIYKHCQQRLLKRKRKYTEFYLMLENVKVAANILFIIISNFC